MIIAMPCPPPMHADATPNFFPRRRSSSSSVSTSRAPLAPSGWPIAIAPPFTLTLSRLRPSSFSHARYCGANASLISIRSRSFRRHLRALERLADRRRRPHAHQRRLDADRRPRHDSAERLRAACLRGILTGNDERRRAVDDAARVAGGHDAVLLEHRRQLRQDLHRRLGTHVIVLLDERDALLRLDLDRRHFFLHDARRPRLVRELLAAQRVGIGVFARDAVLRRAVLRGDRHRAAGVRIVQPFPQPVFELALAQLESAARAANDVRHLAHVLHAAGEHETRLVELECAARR